MKAREKEAPRRSEAPHLFHQTRPQQKRSPEKGIRLHATQRPGLQISIRNSARPLSRMSSRSKQEAYPALFAAIRLRTAFWA